MVEQSSVNNNRTALMIGFSAYLIWGLLPIYMKQLHGVSPVQVVAHRILWSSLIMVGLIAATGGGKAFIANLRSARVLRAMICSALLIFANWLMFIWAAMHGHILAASLGYFINPLLSVGLGVVVLHERLRPTQWIAVAMAVLGVVIIAVDAWTTLWISLILASSFALYGLVRKVAPVGAVQGLAIETCILLPASLVYLGLTTGSTQPFFGPDLSTAALLVLSGVITCGPLLLFAIAARGLSLSTMGLMQYVAPAMQFAIGWWVYGEPLTTSMVICFAFIWTALALFTWDGWRNRQVP